MGAHRRLARWRIAQIGGGVVKERLSLPFLAVIALFSGWVVLLGYFVDLPGLSDLRTLFLDWAVTLVAVAVVVGVIHLARRHAQRIRQGEEGAALNLVTLTSLAMSILAILLSGGLDGEASRWLYNNLWLPLESSLLAVLSVSLIYAFTRLFTRRFTFFGLVFALTTLFVLFTTLPWPGLEALGLAELRAWVLQVWAAAGGRGLLLGIALGAFTAGLRVLLAAENPYSG